MQVVETFLISFGLRVGDRLRGRRYPFGADLVGDRIVVDSHVEVLRISQLRGVRCDFSLL